LKIRNSRFEAKSNHFVSYFFFRNPLDLDGFLTSDTGPCNPATDGPDEAEQNTYR
jgi:hypothetical protein